MGTPCLTLEETWENLKRRTWWFFFYNIKTNFAYCVEKCKEKSSRATSLEETAVMQERDASGLEKDRRCRRGEKWLDSEDRWKRICWWKRCRIRKNQKMSLGFPARATWKMKWLCAEIQTTTGETNTVSKDMWIVRSKSQQNYILTFLTMQTFVPSPRPSLSVSSPHSTSSAPCNAARHQCYTSQWPVSFKEVATLALTYNQNPFRVVLDSLLL